MSPSGSGQALPIARGMKLVVTGRSVPRMSEPVLVRALVDTFKLVRGGSAAAIFSIPIVGGGIAWAAGANHAAIFLWAACSVLGSLQAVVVLTAGLRRLPWADPYLWLRRLRVQLVFAGVVHAGQFAIVPAYRNEIGRAHV